MDRVIIKDIRSDIRDDSVIIAAEIVSGDGIEEKMYRIHSGDYSALPFTCDKGDNFDDSEVFELSVGEDLQFTGNKAEILTFLARKFKIYSSAVGKIAATDVTRKGLIKKLYELYRTQNIEKDELYSLCTAVVDKFVAAGYINDYEYAKKNALYQKESKRWGKRRISEYLYSKGIASDTIREVLDSEEFDDSKDDILYHLNKKYSPDDLSDCKNYMKITGALNRLGFSFGEIKSALAEFVDGADDFDDE